METLLVVVCTHGNNGMSPELESEDDSELRALFRERPADVAMYTISPLVVALALVGNAVVHGLSPVIPAAFAVMLTIYSVMMTRHHLAIAKVTRLQSGWAGVETTAD